MRYLLSIVLTGFMAMNIFGSEVMPLPSDAANSEWRPRSLEEVHDALSALMRGPQGSYQRLLYVFAPGYYERTTTRALERVLQTLEVEELDSLYHYLQCSSVRYGYSRAFGIWAIMTTDLLATSFAVLDAPNNSALIGGVGGTIALISGWQLFTIWHANQEFLKREALVRDELCERMRNYA